MKKNKFDIPAKEDAKVLTGAVAEKPKSTDGEVIKHKAPMVMQLSVKKKAMKK